MFWSKPEIVFAASSLVGLLSAYTASKRQKNPYLWFCIGFGLTLMGVLPIFIAPLIKQKKAAAPKPIPYIKGPKDKFWYYADESRLQQGPFSHDALTRAWREKKIHLHTLVWHEDLATWKPLKEMIRESTPRAPQRSTRIR